MPWRPNSATFLLNVRMFRRSAISMFFFVFFLHFQTTSPLKPWSRFSSYFCIWTFRILSKNSSELNNHSAMTAGKFILALSDEFKFRFISKLFSLKFCMKMIWNKIIRIDSWFFSFRWGMNEKKKNDVHILVWCFHWHLNETKKINLPAVMAEWLFNSELFFERIRNVQIQKYNLSYLNNCGNVHNKQSHVIRMHTK